MFLRKRIITMYLMWKPSCWKKHSEEQNNVPDHKEHPHPFRHTDICCWCISSTEYQDHPTRRCWQRMRERLALALIIERRSCQSSSTSLSRLTSYSGGNDKPLPLEKRLDAVTNSDNLLNCFRTESRKLPAWDTSRLMRSDLVDRDNFTTTSCTDTTGRRSMWER